MLNAITFSRVIWMRCLYCTGVKSIASLRSCYMMTLLRMVVLIQVTRMISTFYSFVHCFLSHPHLLHVWILQTWQTANVKPCFGKLPVIVKPVPLWCTGHKNRAKKIQKMNGIKIFIYSEVLQIMKTYKGLVFSDFRFQKDDMERLLHALQIPGFYICQQRTHASGMEALMILLRRLVYPNCLCDLADVFGRSISELSLITTKVIEFEKLSREILVL